MPTLNWIGKKAVGNHHRQVPFHLLKDMPEPSVGYAVRYLKKLDAIAGKITDWKNFPTHDTYKEELRKIHRLKSALWAKYGSQTEDT